MQRTTLLWTLVAFFGASLSFHAVQRATRHSPVLVTIGLEVVVMAVLIAGIVVLVRHGKED